MRFCTKCGSEFNINKLDGKDLHITSEQNIVDEDDRLVGCRYCLGIFVKDYSTLIERISVRGGLLCLDLRKIESNSDKKSFYTCGEIIKENLNLQPSDPSKIVMSLPY